jgi:hypothetical protein
MHRTENIFIKKGTLTYSAKDSDIAEAFWWRKSYKICCGKFSSQILQISEI